MAAVQMTKSEQNFLFSRCHRPTSTQIYGVSPIHKVTVRHLKVSIPQIQKGCIWMKVSRARSICAYHFIGVYVPEYVLLVLVHQSLSSPEY